MKKTVLGFIILISVLFLSISVCASDGISKQTKTVISETDGTSEYTVITANKFDADTYVLFEFDGLIFEESDYYYCNVKIDGAGSNSCSVESISNNKSLVRLSLYGVQTGIHTFSLTLEKNNSETVFSDLTLDIEIVAPADYPNNGLIANKEDIISEGESDFKISFYSNSYYDGKIIKMLGKDGSVYATGVDSGAYSSYEYINDERYDDVFSPNIPESSRAMHKTVRTTDTVYAAKKITAGVYDLGVYDENGERILLFENCLTVTSKPVISFIEYGSNFFSGNVEKGGNTLYITVSGKNINPEDFNISLFDDENKKVASCSEWIMTNNYGSYTEYSVKMTVEEGVILSTGNTSTKYYTPKVVSDKEFILDEDAKNSELIICDFRAICSVFVPNPDYANFVIKTSGYNNYKKLKLTLSSDSETNYEIYAIPTEDGILDVVFTDYSGRTVKLNKDEQYTINIKSYNEYNSEWEYYGLDYRYYNSNLAYEYYEPEDIVTGYVSTSSVYLNVGITIPANLADEYKENLFYVDAQNVDGTNYKINNFNFEKTTSADGKFTYLDYTGDVSKLLPFGKYSLELLYGDESIYSEPYNIYSDSDDVLVCTQNFGILTALNGFEIYSTDKINNAQVVLYDIINTTPDKTVTLNLENEKGTNFYDITNTEFDFSVPYFYEVKVNGKTKYSNFHNPEYFVWIGKTVNENARYLIDVKQKDGGTISSSIGSVAKEGEFVFINTVPDNGFEYTPLSVKVNGKKIYGRGFMLTENSVIEASFEKERKEKYLVSITFDDSDSNIIAEKQFYMGEGEILTFPETSGDMVFASAYYFTDGNYTFLPKGENSIVMPKGDTQVYVSYITPIHISSEQDLVNLNGDSYSYYILDCDITLTAPWRTISSFTGTIDGNNHIIKNMIIPGNTNVSFISYVYNAYIKNLGIEIEYSSNENSIFSGFADCINNSLVENCFIKGKVNMTDNYYTTNTAIGFANTVNHSQIKNCYSNMDMSLKATSNIATGFINTAEDSEITNCYSNTVIEYSSENINTFTGFINTATECQINNCYYNKGENFAESSYGIPLSEEDMKNKDVYRNWNFTKVWFIDGKLPRLLSIEGPISAKLLRAVKSENSDNIEIYVGLSKDFNGQMIATRYFDGKFTQMYENISENPKQAKFYVKDGFDKVKVFFIKDFQSLSPVCDYVEIDKSDITIK